jgi:hypothetical protein
MKGDTKAEAAVLGLLRPRTAKRLRELAAWECMTVADYARLALRSLMDCSAEDRATIPDRPPLGRHARQPGEGIR